LYSYYFLLLLTHTSLILLLIIIILLLLCCDLSVDDGYDDGGLAYYRVERSLVALSTFPLLGHCVTISAP